MKREPTAEQKVHAAQRRETGRAMAKRIKAMAQEQRAQMIASMNGIATADGHSLSPCNTCMIAMQRPDATIVGGFRQWMKHGRAVKKGEHGHIIWLPRMERLKTADGEQTENESLNGFMLGTVFDVSQTEPLQAEQPAPVVAVPEPAVEPAQVMELALT